MRNWKRLGAEILESLWPPVAALALTFLISSAIILAIGENPLAIFALLFREGLASVDGFARVLNDATPLIFTGLSVSYAFRAGLFNIGGEGQLYMGAFFAALVPLLLPGLPAILALPLAVLAAATGGAAWGAIPGYLRARFGVHEVINTIMMNFIALGLTGYLVVHHLKEAGQMIPHTYEIGESYQLHPFAHSKLGLAMGLDSANPLGPSFLLALLVAVIVFIVFRRSVEGYRLRVSGLNPVAAHYGGIRTGALTVRAMAVSGALAGLVGVHEVLLYRHRFLDNFSSGLGFLGIAVALMGRNHPFGVVLAALLFGFLNTGALEIDIFTEVPRELVVVMQALVIVLVLAMSESATRRKRRRGKGAVT
ncbi:MAG: ABC transporter permease [Candidatus Krumholzibacteria bacterium]|jgi:simple sugar transport system permease protein|nr:ABC transporter permease [Candidatus Krumholzibacteria bacterium]MDP6669720.1 ABC transporter permease [Candidatus Krumholzibacteria bacterium]MDP6797850.1 ABC transporter permease [Candidatus Krumholzibacteria bacterium]MDP7021275.1 ABC transporter permease [Candidatus Krumholzibacteria bacterium]